MLVLSRKVGEEIMIGEQIRIRIIEVSNRSVRIGVGAPRRVPVYREELYQRPKPGGDGTQRRTPAQAIQDKTP